MCSTQRRRSRPARRGLAHGGAGLDRISSLVVNEAIATAVKMRLLSVAALFEHDEKGQLGCIDDQASVEPFVERSGVI